MAEQSDKGEQSEENQIVICGGTGYVILAKLRKY